MSCIALLTSCRPKRKKITVIRSKLEDLLDDLEAKATTQALLRPAVAEVQECLNEAQKAKREIGKAMAAVTQHKDCLKQCSVNLLETSPTPNYLRFLCRMQRLSGLIF